MNTLYLLGILPVLSVDCSRILGIFPAPGYSQFILGEKLMIELARKGHNITVISAYETSEKLENYKTILLDGLANSAVRNLFPRENENIINRIKSVHNLGYKLTEFTLSNKKVQELIYSNETFDLIVLEQFVNEAHMGFGAHFNAPIILFSSIGLSEWNSHLIGDIRLPSIVPVSKTSYTDDMSFFQRLSNSVVNVCDILYKEFISFPQHQKYIDTYFPKKMYLKDIMYNASLMFLNSHASTTQPTSLTSAVVEIGGFHISENKLPKDIQLFLDGAEHGAILVSMGTNLNFTNLSKNKLKDLINVFGKLKQRVLWKFEDEDFPNIPKNVFVSRWLPQIDILAHPNLHAFVTHGGLLSVTEAVYFGVPMVGMPIFGDQRMNVARGVQKGIALYLPLSEATEITLYDAIKEVLENPKYRQQAKMNSVILRDRTVNPLDLAIYWVEYVIRHNGALHLRNSSLDLYWFQLYLIDIFGFMLFIIVTFYYFCKFFIKTIYRKLKIVMQEKRDEKKQQ